jgi:glycosyltransferase involved in cell wall biosynthesis
LIVARRVPPVIGGEERQISQLSSVLRAAGATVDVWTTTPAAVLPWGVRVHVRPGAMQPMPLYLAWLLVSVAGWRLRHLRLPAALVTTRVSGDSALLARVNRLLRIATVVFLTGGLVGGSEFQQQRRPWVRRWIVRGATMIVAHASPFLEEVRAAGFAGPTRTINALVGAEPDSETCPTAEVGLAGSPRLIWCGRNDPVKDLAALSRLLNGALKEIGRPSLLVVADEAPTPPVLGAELHLRCPRPRTHMAVADVLLLTSRFEGQGAVIGEAAIEGTPTVGYAVGGIPEAMASVDGGEVVPAGASDAEYAHAVERVWRRFSDQRERSKLADRAKRVFRDEPPRAWIRAISAATGGARD